MADFDVDSIEKLSSPIRFSARVGKNKNGEILNDATVYGSVQKFPNSSPCTELTVKVTPKSGGDPIAVVYIDLDSGAVKDIDCMEDIRRKSREDYIRGKGNQ